MAKITLNGEKHPKTILSGQNHAFCTTEGKRSMVMVVTIPWSFFWRALLSWITAMVQCQKGPVFMSTITWSQNWVTGQVWVGHHDLMSRIGLYTENIQLLGETEPLTLSNLSNFQVATVGTEENLENQLHKTLQSRGTRILRVGRSERLVLVSSKTIGNKNNTTQSWSRIRRIWNKCPGICWCFYVFAS